MKYVINESQLKNLIKKFFKKDFSDKIQMIQSWEDLPSNFKRMIGSKNILNRYLNMFGPLYVILINGQEYLAQDRVEKWVITDDEDIEISEDKIMSLLGISTLGISMSELIDAYIDE